MDGHLVEQNENGVTIWEHLIRKLIQVMAIQKPIIF